MQRDLNVVSLLRRCARLKASRFECDEFQRGSTMRSMRAMAGAASFFASRMPLVCQQRSPATSIQRTFTVPKRVRIVARIGCSLRSKTMEVMRAMKRNAVLRVAPSVVISFAASGKRAVARGERRPLPMRLALAEQSDRKSVV